MQSTQTSYNYNYERFPHGAGTFLILPDLGPPLLHVWNVCLSSTNLREKSQRHMAQVSQANQPPGSDLKNPRQHPRWPDRCEDCVGNDKSGMLTTQRPRLGAARIKVGATILPTGTARRNWYALSPLGETMMTSSHEGRQRYYFMPKWVGPAKKHVCLG